MHVHEYKNADTHNSISLSIIVLWFTLKHQNNKKWGNMGSIQYRILWALISTSIRVSIFSHNGITFFCLFLSRSPPRHTRKELVFHISHFLCKHLSLQLFLRVSVLVFWICVNKASDLRLLLRFAHILLYWSKGFLTVFHFCKVLLRLCVDSNIRVHF